MRRQTTAPPVESPGAPRTNRLTNRPVHVAVKGKQLASVTSTVDRRSSCCAETIPGCLCCSTDGRQRQVCLDARLSLGIEREGREGIAGRRGTDDMAVIFRL